MNRRRLTALVAVAGAGLVGGCSEAAAPTATRAWPGCEPFAAQPDAQKAFVDAGRPRRADRDGDGVACESLPGGRSSTRAPARPATEGEPGAKTDDCVTSTRPVVVRLSRAKYPESTLHIEQAIRQGAPRVLHIDRAHTDDNRDAWESLVPKSLDTDGDGQVEDRDEIPPAASREGGNRSAAGESLSNIAFVDPSDNRGAGATMGGRLRPYCDGTPFTLRPFSRRTEPTRIVIAARDGRRVHEVVSDR